MTTALDLLSSWWTVGGILALLTAFGAFLFTPFGAPAFAAVAAFAETRVGRWIIGAGAAVVGVLALLARARQSGKDEALDDVKKANETAKNDRQAIEVKVAADKPDALRDELRQWGKGR